MKAPEPLIATWHGREVRVRHDDHYRVHVADGGRTVGLRRL
ncbi:MAG TPA: hypothetical protein VJZ50_02390 [Candidatus Limnocylindrales bacterium]|nr:hypothetical protein [Candidatus Limnocylindrales bacterium]